MVIIVFLLILLITINITNKKNEAKASDEVLEFEFKDSVAIFVLFIVSILINKSIKLFSLQKYSLYILGFSALFFSCCLIIINTNREKMIKRKHDQIINVYQALSDILGKAEIVFENMPFTIEEDKKLKKINKITIDTSNQNIRANENTITLATYSMNKFFPDYEWMSKQNHQQRELQFIGLPKPPKIAKYPGSDYRPTGWIPLGVSGLGEVGWNLANPKDLGISSFIGEDGNIAGTVEMPSAPQALCVGSTGGGKAVWVEQEIF